MNDYDEKLDPYEVNDDPSEPPEDSGPVDHQISPTSVFCIQCGYNLTGVAIGSTCPECGRRVAPSFHGQVLPSSGKAVASMVLGICSIVGCLFYGIPAITCGPLAIIFAVLAKGQIQRGEVSGASKGMAIAGMICGIIGTCLALLFIGFIVVAIMFGSP